MPVLLNKDTKITPQCVGGRMRALFPAILFLVLVACQISEADILRAGEGCDSALKSAEGLELSRAGLTIKINRDGDKAIIYTWPKKEHGAEYVCRVHANEIMKLTKDGKSIIGKVPLVDLHL